MMERVLVALLNSLPGPIQYRLLKLMWQRNGLTLADIDAFLDREFPKQEDL
jgi:hypothetical protein